MFFARLPDAERLSQLNYEFNFICTYNCCLGNPASSSSIVEPLGDEELAALPDKIGNVLQYWDQDEARSAYIKMMKFLKNYHGTMTAKEFLIDQKRAFLLLQFSCRPKLPFKSDPLIQ